MSDGTDPALLAERFGRPDTDRSRLLAQASAEQDRPPAPRRRVRRRRTSDDLYGRRLDALDQALNSHPDGGRQDGDHA